MSLERAYRDYLLFIAFIGLIVGSIFAFYVYFTTYDTRLLVFAVVMMFLGVLMGIARVVFTVEFWRAIFENWRKH
ncbi:MAG: hypothetical protein ABR962_00895 [Candidatus Bathyarchaeia archaeon]